MIREKIKKIFSIKRKKKEDTFCSQIADKYQMDYQCLSQHTTLIHFWGSEKKGDRAFPNSKNSIHNIITEKYMEKEIRTIIKADGISKHQMLNFENLKRFFNSLSLEEERQLKEMLKHFYQNIPLEKSGIRNDLINEIYRKHQRTTISELTGMIQEDETRILAHAIAKHANRSQTVSIDENGVLNLMEELKDKQEQLEHMQISMDRLVQKAEEYEEKESIMNDTRKVRQLTDEVLIQIRDQLKLENMRRGR